LVLRDPPAPSPLDVTRVERLVAHFDRLAFRANRRERVTRWVTPIRIALRGDDAERWRPMVAAYAARLATLTGLEIGLVDRTRDSSANLYLKLVPRERLYRLAIAYDDVTARSILREKADDGFGMTIIIPMTATKITEAAVLLATDPGDDWLAMAIRHDLVHALGMLFHSTVLQPTLMGPEIGLSDLSDGDRIVIRALYDPRLRPGMTSDEAMPIARAIIGELVAEAAARAD